VALASAALLSGCAYRPMGGPAPVTSESMPTPAETASASPWQKVKASFTSSSKKVADAATPKEQHIKAKDPLALSAPSKKPGADLYVPAARIHESTGDYAAAAGQYERALAVDGNDLAALVGYGHLLDRQRKHTEATLYYERATKAHPTSAAAWNDLGLCYSRRSKTDRAMLEKSMAALRRAVELNPEKKLYRNNIAAVLVEAGRDGEALTHLMAAHDPATAHYNLGYLSNQQGRLDAARHHFAEALRLNPQMHAARSFLDQLNQQQNHAVAEHRVSQEYAPRSLFVPKQEASSVLAPASREEPRAMPGLNQGAKAAAKPRVVEISPVVAAPVVMPAAVELPFDDVEAEQAATSTAIYEAPVDAAVADAIEPAVYEDAPGPDDTFGDAPMPE
jgi:tetratricopeptide (TPR) repeat protein